jgi:hypothetical protein
MVSNCGKCYWVATNADQVPQQTPLVAVASKQPLNSSIAMDRDAAIEDGRQPIQHQVLNPGSQGPQGLQLSIRLSSCSLLYPKPSIGLFQLVRESALTGWRSKKRIIDPRARPLMA